MQKSRSHKRSALLAFSLLIGLCLCCFLWVRKEQRQYALNRQLIAALKKRDTKQAIALVEAGADPNTPEKPPPAPFGPNSFKKLLQRSLPSFDEGLTIDKSSTAFQMVCGNSWYGNPLLSKAMLRHGANVNITDVSGLTALHWAIMFQDNTIIKQLITYGADPNISGAGYATPIEFAKEYHRSDLVVLLRKYSKHP